MFSTVVLWLVFTYLTFSLFSLVYVLFKGARLNSKTSVFVHIIAWFLLGTYLMG